MKIAVLGTNDTGAWRSALERLPAADVYHLPEYHLAVEANGEGRARAFVAEDGGDTLLHPFLQRRIERVGDETLAEDWFDLESVYGYSGPLSTTDDPDFLARAWSAFDGWCAEQRVVAEFIRFNPLLRNERFAPPESEVVVDRETVVLPLDVGEDELWASYPSVQRNMVRKAEAKGLVAAAVDLLSGLPGFRRIYDETMQRVNADDYYAFGAPYFEALAAMAEHVRLFEVRAEGDLAAAGLFFVYGGRMHYHLSGTEEAFRSAAATNLLLHGAASWGRENGLTVLHLGGGRTPDPDDALLRFKAGLSRVRLTFSTARRVHHLRMYNDLCSQWLRQAHPDVRPPYFLVYRLDVPR